MNKLVAVLALSFAGAAWGQTGELWFNLGASILSSNTIGEIPVTLTTNAPVNLDDGYRFSFRFGFNSGDHLGYEVQYAFNHTQLDVGGQKQAMHFHQGGVNVLYYLNKDRARIRPFATAGIMFDDFVPPGGGINYGSQNKFGANFGAGVKFHIKGMWAGRFDVREYFTGKPDFGILTGTSGALWQTEVSAGVGIGF